jgi:D-galactarolactone cycloisomerase
MKIELGITVHPHTSVTGLNMAASLHVLAVLKNGGYFEADPTPFNPFRDTLCRPLPDLDPDGTAAPPPGPGLGIEVDADLLAEFRAIPGAGYV